MALSAYVVSLTREEDIARAADINSTLTAQIFISDKRFLIIKRAAPTEQRTPVRDRLKIRDRTIPLTIAHRFPPYAAPVLPLPRLLAAN